MDRHQHTKCTFNFLSSRFLGRHAPFATSHIVGRENKTMNNKTMRPDTKNNGAAGYLDPVKIELTKGAGLLRGFFLLDSYSILCQK